VSRLAPIVLFAYNRPGHTRDALESLASNPEAARSELYVFCDAPPAHSAVAELDRVEQTRRIVRERDWCGHVELVEATRHHGCDESMLSGIDRIISAHERVIVLEDDLVVSPNLLSFLNTGLDTYECEPRVGAVSGYMYPVTHTGLPRTFFHCLLNFWGWGTWERAWRQFEPDAAVSLAALRSRDLVDRFILGRPIYLEYLIKLQGRKDSYDILWYASLLARDMLVLYPGRSLVRNRGFDLTGTHLSILDRPNLAFQEQEIANCPVDVVPQPIVEDHSVTDAILQSNAYIWA
jgi:hypothetical protein